MKNKTYLLSWQKLDALMRWAYQEGKHGVCELTFKHRREERIKEKIT